MAHNMLVLTGSVVCWRCMSLPARVEMTGGFAVKAVLLSATAPRLWRSCCPRACPTSRRSARIVPSATRAVADGRANWSLLEDDHIRYMDDTSKHTARSVRTACASQALHELLESHGFAECSLAGPRGEAVRFCDKTRGSGSGRNGGSSTVTGRRDGRGGVDGDGASRVEKRSLTETLPFYLHVSGWLDASANAAIMAFTTVPCR